MVSNEARARDARASRIASFLHFLPIVASRAGGRARTDEGAFGLTLFCWRYFK
jgi:hypothetical protein